MKNNIFSLFLFSYFHLGMETNIERGRETEGSWELKIKESERNPFEKITKTDLGLSLKTVSVATAEANPVIYTNKNKTEQTMLCFFLLLLFFFLGYIHKGIKLLQHVR